MKDIYDQNTDSSACYFLTGLECPKLLWNIFLNQDSKNHIINNLQPNFH